MKKLKLAIAVFIIAISVLIIAKTVMVHYMESHLDNVAASSYKAAFEAKRAAEVEERIKTMMVADMEVERKLRGGVTIVAFDNYFSKDKLHAEPLGYFCGVIAVMSDGTRILLDKYRCVN